jgi:hypothetical protein
MFVRRPHVLRREFRTGTQSVRPLVQFFPKWTVCRAQSETAISDKGSDPTSVLTLIVFRLEAL